MTDNIGPLARLFRGMADRVDHDRTSQTRNEAIVKAAGRGSRPPAPQPRGP